MTGGRLSALFKKACGKPLTNEISEYLKKSGELKYEDVAMTGAHGLKAKKIYHISLKQKDPAGDYIKVSIIIIILPS